MRVTNKTELKVGDKVFVAIDKNLYPDSIEETAWDFDNSWQEIESININGNGTQFMYDYFLKGDADGNVFLWPDFKEYIKIGELHCSHNSKFLSFKELPLI